MTRKEYVNVTRRLKKINEKKRKIMFLSAMKILLHKIGPEGRAKFFKFAFQEGLSGCKHTFFWSDYSHKKICLNCGRIEE
jgi:hypothetical protein